MKPPLRSLHFLQAFIFVCLLIFILPVFSLAQSSPFVPSPVDSAMLKNLLGKYEEANKSELAALPSNYKEDYQKIYKQRWENIKEKFDEKEIYTSPKAQQYLDGMVAEIVKGNPVLKNHSFRCYFSCSGSPN